MDQKPDEKWKPDQVFRLVVLVAGLIFFGVGVWMVVQGIEAEGTIDIKSSILSGSLESGSAGLFVLLLAFFLVVLAMAPNLSKLIDKDDSHSPAKSKTLFRRVLKICLLEVALIILFVTLAGTVPGADILGFVAFMLSFLLMFSLFLLLVAAEE